jgi:xanthine phosphoribosyltransferase
MIDSERGKEIVAMLYDRIKEEGTVIGTDILKVDSFLNHQIDPAFTLMLGQELARRFGHSQVTKILTLEASGIAVAMATGLSLNVPVLFAKKGRPNTLQGESYVVRVFSFTRQVQTDIFVSQRFLCPNDIVLIIDDFLAHGEALKGLIDLVQQAGSRLAGAGVVIEKRFQHGGDKPRQEGVRIEALAAIDSMQPGMISFINRLNFIK